MTTTTSPAPAETLHPMARPGRRLRRTLLILTLVQAVGGVAVLGRGFPYFGSQLVSNAPLWETPLALFHVPGILVLSLAGLCCGFGRSLILGPKIVAGHVPVTVSGTSILAVTNWLVWTALLMVAAGLWRLGRSRRRSSGSADDAPATPAAS
jgi:hypothetical protein